MFASKTLFGSDRTKVANEQRVTRNGADVHRKVLNNNLKVSIRNEILNIQCIYLLIKIEKIREI